MFSLNKEFKYESDVKKIINESNSNIINWVTILEQKIYHLEQTIKNQELTNKYLNQENQLLKQNINNLEQKLEKRITDFTDVWHPIMMANINRIKNELVDEVDNKVETIIDNKINILVGDRLGDFNNNINDMNNKIISTELKIDELKNKFDSTGLEGFTVIGNKEIYGDGDPIFINKNNFQKMINSAIHDPNPYYCIGNIFNRNSGCGVYLNIFKFYKGIVNMIEISDFKKFYETRGHFSDKYGQAIMIYEQSFNSSDGLNIYPIGPRISKSGFRKILEVLDECDIKLVHNGSEFINGQKIRDLFLF